MLKNINNLIELITILSLVTIGTITTGIFTTALSQDSQEQQDRCYHKSESIEKSIGFCQAVRVGNTLYISGTGGSGKMPQAISSVYDALEKTLEAHDLSFEDVVRENIFTTDLDSFISNQRLRKDYYGSTFPASTWVQVERLYLSSYVLEVELTAIFSDE